MNYRFKYTIQYAVNSWSFIYYFNHFVILAALVLLLAMLGSIILTVGLSSSVIKLDNSYSKTKRGDMRLAYWRLYRN